MFTINYRFLLKWLFYANSGIVTYEVIALIKKNQ